jgi:hypothetical protein
MDGLPVFDTEARKVFFRQYGTPIAWHNFAPDLSRSVDKSKRPRCNSVLLGR